MRPDLRPCCAAGSLTEPIEGRFSLITCIEVLEHMPEDEARRAIHNMCLASDAILFSSSPSDFGEESHVNVHSPLFWMKAFETENFSPDIGYDASFVSPHAFLLRATQAPLPREVLVLMSEELRWRREWVAAHQAFCLASDRAIASGKQNEALTADLTTSRQSVEERERTLQEWSAQIRAEARGGPFGGARSSKRRSRGRMREDAAAQTRRADGPNGSAKKPASWRRANATNSTGNWRSATGNWNRSGPAPHGSCLPDTDNGSIGTDGSPGSATTLSPDCCGFSDCRSGPPGRVRRGCASGPGSRCVPGGRGHASGRAFVPARSRARARRIPLRGLGSWFEPGAAELDLQREIGEQFAMRPKISIITPVYKVPLNVVRELIGSVTAQAYGNWELCLAHAWPGGRDVRDYLGAAAAKDRASGFCCSKKIWGIAENSNRALELASGEYAALLDHDDTLAPSALYETVRALNERGPADLLYSDKDQLAGGTGQRVSPLFKPKWSPEIMLSANYLTHLTTMRTDVIRTAGGWRTATDGAQDWDLFLRVIGAGKRVSHIPKVLYHWRQIATSVASGGMSAKPYAAEAQMRTMRDYFAANGWSADVVCEPELRVKWKAPPNCTVSVILMTSPGRSGLTALAQEFGGTSRDNRSRFSSPRAKRKILPG